MLLIIILLHICTINSSHIMSHPAKHHKYLKPINKYLRDSSELGSLAVWSSTLFSCILITTLAIVYYLYDHFGGLIYYYLVMV